MVAEAPLASLNVAGSSTPTVPPAKTALNVLHGIEERLMDGLRRRGHSVTISSALAISSCRGRYPNHSIGILIEYMAAA